MLRFEQDDDSWMDLDVRLYNFTRLSETRCANCQKRHLCDRQLYAPCNSNSAVQNVNPSEMTKLVSFGMFDIYQVQGSKRRPMTLAAKFTR